MNERELIDTLQTGSPPPIRGKTVHIGQSRQRKKIVEKEIAAAAAKSKKQKRHLPISLKVKREGESASGIPLGWRGAAASIRSQVGGRAGGVSEKAAEELKKKKGGRLISLILTKKRAG